MIMKKLSYILSALLIAGSSAIFSSCGDNEDFWGPHTLTDDEIAEQERQEEIKRQQRERIDADLILEYTVPEDATTGYTDWSNHITTFEGGADIELGGLLDDLGWEFCCELHRRQDLIRFKMSDGRSVWNGKSWFCKDATTSTTYSIFSIPNEAMRPMSV